MSSQSPMTVAAVSGTGETISCGFLNGVVTYQSFNGATNIIPPQKMHQQPVRCIRFSADGRLLASGSDDTLATVMDTGSGTGRQFRGHDAPVTSIDVSDGGLVATGSGDHTVRVWTQDSSTHRHRIPCPMGVSHVSLSPRGHLLATGGPGGATIFDTGDWKSLTVGTEASVKLVRFSRDGSRLATVTTANVVRVWDTSKAFDTITLPLLAERSEGARINDVTFGFKGDRLGICRDDGVLIIWLHGLNRFMQPKFGDTSVPMKIWTMDFVADDGFLPLFTGRTA